jgi:DNA-binding response OmpR family regulator
VYGSDLSLSEAAEALSLSPSAAKSRLHRAREQLRKELLTMAPSEEAWELRTILLVAPDPGTQVSLRDGLTSAGYEVLALPTGEDAILAVQDRRGQCLILDKHCITPHWLEVMALVQTDPWGLKHVPICALVDPDNERDVFAAWHAGATVCLSRPPSAERVVGYVKHLQETWGRH